MNIVGSFRKEEKKEILDIATVFIVATKSRLLGKIAKQQKDIYNLWWKNEVGEEASQIQ